MLQNIENGLSGAVARGSGALSRGTQKGSGLESAADDTHGIGGFSSYLKGLRSVFAV